MVVAIMCIAWLSSVFIRSSRCGGRLCLLWAGLRHRTILHRTGLHRRTALLHLITLIQILSRMIVPIMRVAGFSPVSIRLAGCGCCLLLRCLYLFRPWTLFSLLLKVLLGLI